MSQSVRGVMPLVIGGLTLFNRVLRQTSDEMASTQKVLAQSFRKYLYTRKTYESEFVPYKQYVMQNKRTGQKYKMDFLPEGPKLYQYDKLLLDWKETEKMGDRTLKQIARSLNIKSQKEKLERYYDISELERKHEVKHWQSEDITRPLSMSEIKDEMMGYLKESPIANFFRSFKQPTQGFDSLTKHKMADMGLGSTTDSLEAIKMKGGDILKGIITAPIDFLGKTGGKIKGFGEKAWGGLGKLAGVPPDKWKAIGSAMGNIAGGALMGGALGIVLSILMQLLDVINPFKPIMEALTTIFGIYGEILSQAFMPLIEALFEIMLSDTTISLLTTLATTMAQVIQAFLPFLYVLQPIGELLLTGLVAGMSVFSTILVALATPLMSLVNGLGWLLSQIVDFVSFFYLSVAPVFNAVLEFFNALIHFDFNALGKAFVNVFLEIINSIIRLVNRIPGVNIKEIPKLALGGLVMKPTLALVGEQGPELITPYSEIKNQMEGKGKSEVIINIYGDVSEEKILNLRHELLIKGVF